MSLGLAVLLALAFAASMAGGLAPTVEGFLERLGLERILSFRSGVLIAVALTDVLPDGWKLSPLPFTAAAAAALGLGWYLHRGRGEHAGHELTHPHVHGGDAGAHLPATIAALFAHSLIDGVNLGAAAFLGGTALAAVGAATVLHKIADGFTVTSLFHQTGHPRGRVLGLLVLVSLATPAGALLARAGALALGPALAATMLGFAGGSFLFVGAATAAPLLRRGGARTAYSFGGGFAALLLLRGLAP
jgi:zinc transporter ZupT